MTTKKIPELRAFALDVVRRLRAAGFVAYWAGGCVRDLVLGHLPKDFDVATSARPEEVQQLFPKTIAVGASFGVINVIGGRGRTVEVATFRTDTTYTDGRHPDSVIYSTPEEDAKRRDFTINGMFLDPLTEEILDFVGGREDIDRRIVRAIGDPTARITEDKLRMLRAVRFASRYGFSIEAHTHAAIRSMATGLSVISAERILAELRGILQSPARVRGLELLWETGLFEVALPELVEDLSAPETMGETLAVLGHWTGAVDLSLALAALVSAIPDDRAGPMIDSLLVRLKASNEDRDRAGLLIKHRRSLDDVASLPVHHVKRVLANPGREDLLLLIEATEHARTGAGANAEQIRERAEEWGDEGIDPPPVLTGDDLIAHGYRPGRQFKVILDAVRDKQLDGELTTQEEALAWVESTWPR